MKRFQVIVVVGGALVAVACFCFSVSARRSQSRPAGSVVALYNANIFYYVPQGAVDVGELDVPPVVTAKFPVAYPPALIGSGIIGRARVFAILRADGGVSMIQVSSASDSRFVKFIEDAAKQWSFSAPMKGGRAVPACIECEVAVSERSNSGPTVVAPNKKPNQSSQHNAMAWAISVFESRSSRG